VSDAVRERETCWKKKKKKGEKEKKRRKREEEEKEKWIFRPWVFMR
jgi:hypothetical protein